MRMRIVFALLLPLVLSGCLGGPCGRLAVTLGASATQQAEQVPMRAAAGYLYCKYKRTTILPPWDQIAQAAAQNALSASRGGRFFMGGTIAQWERRSSPSRNFRK